MTGREGPLVLRPAGTVRRMRTATIAATVLALLAGGATAAQAAPTSRPGSSATMCRVATVPNVIGLDQRAAVTRMRWAGFRNVRVTVQKGGLAPTYGPVWGTYPAPGTRSNRCGEVVIVLAGGG